MKYIRCPYCKSTKLEMWEDGECSYDASSHLQVEDGKIVATETRYNYKGHRPHTQYISCSNCGNPIAYSLEQMEYLDLEFTDEPYEGDQGDIDGPLKELQKMYEESLTDWGKDPDLDEYEAYSIYDLADEITREILSFEDYEDI